MALERAARRSYYGVPEPNYLITHIIRYPYHCLYYYLYRRLYRRLYYSPYRLGRPKNLIYWRYTLY